MIIDNGSSHRGKRSIDLPHGAWPNLIVLHTPVHASSLNQAEIYFSVVQRKVLTPNDFADLDALEAHVLAFGRRYEQIAAPFQRMFTRHDLHELLAKTDATQLTTLAASPPRYVRELPSQTTKLLRVSDLPAGEDAEDGPGHPGEVLRRGRADQPPRLAARLAGASEHERGVNRRLAHERPPGPGRRV